MNSGLYFFYSMKSSINLKNDFLKYQKGSDALYGLNKKKYEFNFKLNNRSRGNSYLFFKRANFECISIKEIIGNKESNGQIINQKPFFYIVSDRVEELKINIVSNENIEFCELVIAKMIGGLRGIPIVRSSGHMKKYRKKISAADKFYCDFKKGPFVTNINFKDYPMSGAYEKDIDIIYEVLSEDNFYYINYCAEETSSFVEAEMGINEPFLCSILSRTNISFTKNVYNSNVNFNIEIGEVM